MTSGNALTSEDRELLRIATDVLDANHDPVIHQVAAALRTRTGEVFTGIHLGSRRINVCAESSAIANSVMADAGTLDTIVAVCRDEDGRTVVTNPCGVCRELLTTYGPTATVIVDIHGSVRKVPADALLPNPWMFPHENDWSVENPLDGDAR